MAQPAEEGPPDVPVGPPESDTYPILIASNKRSEQLNFNGKLYRLKSPRDKPSCRWVCAQNDCKGSVVGRYPINNNRAELQLQLKQAHSCNIDSDYIVRREYIQRMKMKTIGDGGLIKGMTAFNAHRESSFEIDSKHTELVDFYPTLLSIKSTLCKFKRRHRKFEKAPTKQDQLPDLEVPEALKKTLIRGELFLLLPALA